MDGNPLTAHLPLAPETDKDAFLALGLRPEFQESERDLPTAIRRLRINRLRRFFAPVLPAHRRALSSICTSVIDGYIARNPITANGQRILHGERVDLPIKPAITMVTGFSGMGKSALISRTLDYLGGQVWQHTAFRGTPFTEAQIVWLRRNVPHRCTVGTLCTTFGDYTDEVLGLKLYGGLFAKMKGKDQTLHLAEIRRIVTTHHVGALVLDEFQNLSMMGVGAKMIISLLVNLRDELGIPIILVGTYKALNLLASEMSTARRMVEGGYFDLQRPLSPADVGWLQLCKTAWAFQWVRKPVPFSESIAVALYEVSQGITGIMLTVFATAQIAAMEDGSEYVDEDLIRKVFDERMAPLHPAVRVLQSGDWKLQQQFDDLYKNLWPSPQGESGSDLPEAPNEAEAVACGSAVQAETKRQSGSAKGKAERPPRKESAKVSLTSEQVKQLVEANSIKSIIDLLDKP